MANYRGRCIGRNLHQTLFLMDLQTRLMLFVPLTGPHVADGSVQHFEDIPVRVVVDAQIANPNISYVGSAIGLAPGPSPGKT
jgi:hypothetical protein